MIAVQIQNEKIPNKWPQSKKISSLFKAKNDECDYNNLNISYRWLNTRDWIFFKAFFQDGLFTLSQSNAQESTQYNKHLHFYLICFFFVAVWSITRICFVLNRLFGLFTGKLHWSFGMFPLLEQMVHWWQSQRFAYFK